MSNLRRVFITWNNWQDEFDDKEAVQEYFEALPHIKAFVIGFETGEDKATPHLQGVLQFSQQKTFKTLVKYMKKNHIEKVKSMEASVKYCKKEGDFIEHGKIAEERARTDIQDFKEAIMEGRDIVELLEEYPQQMLQYHSAVERLMKEVKAKEFKTKKRDVQTLYIAGESGVGKTTFIYDKFGYDEVFRVTSYDHPFDGYKGERVLFLDEFRSQIKFNVMLNLLDGFPMELNARYSNTWAQFDIVIIATNWHYNKQYENYFEDNSEDMAAWDRRLPRRYYIKHSNKEEQFDIISKHIDKHIDQGDQNE